MSRLQTLLLLLLVQQLLRLYHLHFSQKQYYIITWDRLPAARTRWLAHRFRTQLPTGVCTRNTFVM
jgi:hypothetical protein